MLHPRQFFRNGYLRPYQAGMKTHSNQQIHDSFWSTEYAPDSSKYHTGLIFGNALEFLLPTKKRSLRRMNGHNRAKTGNVIFYI